MKKGKIKTATKKLVAAKSTPKNQVTIPKIVRQKLGVHFHDERAVQFQEEDSKSLNEDD